VIDEIEKKAIAVIAQVFETMFFTPIAVQQGESEDLYSPIKSFSAFLKGEIGFEGKHSGTLILSVPVELAKTMASNFMGLEEESASDSQAVDMVNELCNMICGNLFSQLDKKTVWNLTIPQTREVSGQAMDAGNGDQAMSVRFNAEGYPVQLQIQFTPLESSAACGGA
jgi:CheY-specific phosphatase CheX